MTKEQFEIKEQFEKEAEEYKDNTRIKDKNTYVGFPYEHISELQDYEGNYIDISERIIKAFKDGAEFGYNKANEWHYVKDGDLPTENIYLIIRLNDENTCYKYCTGFWEKEEKCFHTLFCSVVDTKDIIAWKEIVPPDIEED